MRISVEKKEEIMERIISVAEKQIADSGLQNLNLRTIAAEADIKTGTLYNHFKGGIDELVLFVNSRTVKLLDAVLAKAVGESSGQSVVFLFQHLAIAYLHFAADHPMRFASLFEHKMTSGAPIPDWHLQEHYALFRHVEQPLSALGSSLSEPERKVLARSIYSSVHGIVQLGLHGRMLALPVPVLEEQLKIVTGLLALGLSRLPSKGDQVGQV